MKKALSLFVLTLVLSSCHDYWPQEDKDAYYQTCHEDAMRWAGTEANAKTYCDCVLEKVTTKYKTVEELMEHAMEIKDDPEIQGCRETITPPQP